jgi:hypothetical protein
MAVSERNPRVLAIDAGGTMTDTFIVDRSGQFVVGKAQTTPEDESIGFMRSAEDALAYWGAAPEQSFPRIVSGIYSGTAMLNRLLERKGRKVGCIVSGGLEDYFKLERGIQTYLGFSYSDRLHVATHFHNQPLVPRKLMHGVRERIDLFGDVAIPLYDDEVRGGGADGRGSRLDRRVPALQLAQPRARAARQGARRGGQGRTRRQRGWPGRVPLLGALPDAARLPEAQLDAD